MLTKPKEKGELSQSIVITELLRRGIPVSVPFGDNQAYDVVMDVCDQLHRIQIKTGNYKGDRVVFSTARKYHHSGGGRKPYTEDEIDFFIVYCYELNELYMVPIHNLPHSEARLRLSPPKSNYSGKIRWAHEYQLDRQLALLYEKEAVVHGKS